MTSQEMMTSSANGVKSNAQSAHEMIESVLGEVEYAMLTAVDSDIDVLRDASRHILEAGGKRIRPRLLVLAYAATGGTDFGSVVEPAAAVELVHTASVVHDDINDHGMLRRGRPSINSIWGRTFALLTGDFLFTKVYELMAPYERMNVLLSDATVALVEGETLQASAVKNNNLTSEVYMQIIGLKTAALFRSAARIGASMANAHDDEIEALASFGYNVGLAFQIVDDILDLVGDEDQVGKTTGLDGQQGKGFAAVADDDIINAVKGKLLNGDRIEKARMQANMLVRSAINELDSVRDTPFKHILVDLANQIVARKF